MRDSREVSFLEGIAHFWIMAGRSFLRNRCLVRASALTYTTLLALIPLLSVGLSVAQSFLNTDGGNRL